LGQANAGSPRGSVELNCCVRSAIIGKGKKELSTVRIEPWTTALQKGKS